MDVRGQAAAKGLGSRGPFQVESECSRSQILARALSGSVLIGEPARSRGEALHVDLRPLRAATHYGRAGGHVEIDFLIPLINYGAMGWLGRNNFRATRALAGWRCDLDSEDDVANLSLSKRSHLGVVLLTWAFRGASPFGTFCVKGYSDS